MDYQWEPSTWMSVGLFVAVFGIWWGFYQVCNFRIAGYALLMLMLLQKCVTLFILQLEPMDILIVVKIFSVIPFVLALQYYRYDAPDSQSKCWANFFAVVLAVNILEPGLLKEIKQGIYINSLAGFLLAALTILVGWNTGSVKNKQFVVRGAGWAYASAYFVWHICLFYAQIYELSAVPACGEDTLTAICGEGPDYLNPDSDCQNRIDDCRGNYFIFDTVLNIFPMVMSVFSEYGPQSWPQARAYSLAFKLAMNAIWTSQGVSAEFVRLMYVEITFDEVVFFWFQIFVLVMMALGFYYEAQRRNGKGAAQSNPQSSEPPCSESFGDAAQSEP
mmetsp:Transcript_132933/g.335684  ORF Transcript_132933/g.335684 Transcript_132933/m.335684 type:complete len:332 (+) Transcript_132933:43-1038(+)